MFYCFGYKVLGFCDKLVGFFLFFVDENIWVRDYGGKEKVKEKKREIFW